jgi:pSer/pThr/pTyr-binding forkhead associated (FHA) protein
MIICPDCGHHNRQGAVICDNCGKTLAGDFSVTQNVPTSKTSSFDIEPVIVTTDLNLKVSLMLIVQTDGTPGTFAMTREKGVYVVGRTDPGTAIGSVDIDLALHGAHTLGVSRRHARIFLNEDIWMLEDLGSTNGTYINGRRMYPDQHYILHHGDQIQFGKLVSQVYFRDDR